MDRSGKRLQLFFKNKFFRVLSWVLFSIYILYLVKILFIGSNLASRGHHGFTLQYGYNLIPLKTITNYIVNFDHYNFNTWFYNLFGNVAAFMPLGFLLPILIKSMDRFSKIIPLVFLVSVFVELMQFIVSVGEMDVDDVLLNTIGGAAGYIALIVLERLSAVKTSNHIPLKELKGRKDIVR